MSFRLRHTPAGRQIDEPPSRKDGDVIQGEPKRSRKAKHSPTLEPISSPELQSLDKFELFRLEQWGMVLQSKIVPIAREVWFGRRKKYTFFKGGDDKKK